MRARWLALGLLLGLVSIASGQGGPGFFMAPSCATIANPATGQTVCWQTTAPNSFVYWDGAGFAAPVLGGPYASLTFTAGELLVGQGAGALTSTPTPTVSGITTTGQAGVSLGVYGTSTGNTGELRFAELAANGAEYVGWKAPDAIATSIIFKLPATTGTNGQCFVTDGASPTATISFGACSGGGSGITSLNALAGSVQTFTNETNMTIVSGGSAHVLTWAGTLAVPRGGLGVGTLAANGALYGNGTGAVLATAAGAADTVLRVPGGGGAPAFGAIDVSKAAALTGLVRTANLGAGVADATTFLRGDQTYAANSVVPVYNFVYNSDMELWGAGASAAPTAWTSLGGTFARTTGTTNTRTGVASVAVTRASGTAGLTQDLIIRQPHNRWWRNQVVSCGVWAKASVASTTQIRLDDATTVTNSTAHSGSGVFEWLTVSASVGSSATVMKVGLIVSTTNTTSNFDSAICVMGSSISNWQPSGGLGSKTAVGLGSGTAQISSNQTLYFGAYVMGSSEKTWAVLLPFRCVARNFVVKEENAPGGAQTLTLTLRKNEASTAITCQISAAATTCSDLANDVEYQQQDRLSVQAVNSLSAVASAIVASVECVEVPAGL
jgi:hypothetical protein